MVVYQVHKCGGEWEEYIDIVVGTYLHKKDAEARLKECKVTAAKEQEKAAKCKACPYMLYDDIASPTISALKRETFMRKAKLHCADFVAGDSGCDGYCWNPDVYIFNIAEVEVIE